jgi:cardiolipin synthase
VPGLFLGLLLLLLVPACAPQPIDYHIEGLDYSVRDPQFARTVGQLLDPPLVPGNNVTTLVNGDEIFPAMIAAIASAKETVTFETYLYWSGHIGQQFADALAERARHGVKVHLLVDWFGSSSWIGNRNTINQKYLDQLQAAGVEVQQYHPFNLFDCGTWANADHRTHRKLLIIDGKLGFTGGTGIADDWDGHAQDPQHWRDNHYRIAGPVVAQLQAAFVEDWIEASGHVLAGKEYFPELPRAGNQWAQVFATTSATGAQNMQLLTILSIAAARENIRIESAYFIPDRVIEKYLIAARKRGVRVEIIVPGPHIDEPIVREVSRSHWERLLLAGVEIYEYQPTMFHCKQIIIDDAWVSVGSSNQDNRSFRLNGEANLNVLDTGFAAEQTRYFEDDVKASRRITHQEWSNRPWDERCRTCFEDLFRWEL